MSLDRIVISKKWDVASAESKSTAIYEDVKVYDYASKGFHKLRYIDGISSFTIKDSLDPDTNLENAQKAGESTGKSGSFMFFTKDRKFVIKTCFQEELDIFMQDLKEYFTYLDQNKDSLVARIYGIFQVQMKGVVPVNFLLMSNVIKV